MMSFYQKKFAIGVGEKKIFFLAPREIFFYFISIPFFGTYFKNWQRYNFWTDAYFYMKFEICRWNSMQITMKFLKIDYH